MKKIVQINVACNYGSTGRIIEQLGILAQKRGYESYIFHSARYAYKSAHQSFCFGSLLDEYLHGLKSFIFDSHGLGSNQATLKVIEKIDQISPDIIHLHNLHGYYINYQILFEYLKCKDIPIIWTLHDCWAFTGHCAHFSCIGCNKWQSECFECPQKHAYPYSIFDFSRRNFLLKREAFIGCKDLTIVPVSNWLADLLKKSFLNCYPIKRIYNGIDTNVFNILNKNNLKCKLGIQNKFVLLGVASSWGYKKGFDDFITLSKMLSNDIVIIMVGLNSRQIKELPSNIIGISRTNNIIELAKLYSSADLFLNLTYEDTFPTTNLEAMSCGTPVLTYETGGSPEALQPNLGFVVKQGDLENVLSCVNKVKNGETMEGICYRNHVVERFKIEDRYEEYIQLYDKKVH